MTPAASVGGWAEGRGGAVKENKSEQKVELRNARFGGTPNKLHSLVIF